MPRLFTLEEVQTIITNYEDYITLLGDELNDLMGLATVHGWQSSRVELGEQGRAKLQPYRDLIGD